MLRRRTATDAESRSHRCTGHTFRPGLLHQCALRAIAGDGTHRLLFTRARHSRQLRGCRRGGDLEPQRADLSRPAAEGGLSYGTRRQIPHSSGAFDHWIIHPGQGEYFDPVFIDNGVERTIEGYATDITGDLALEFLDGIAPSQPFCLVYQFKAPHRPFTPAPRHANLFADVGPQKPPTYNDDYSSRALAAVAEDMRFDVSLAPDYGDEIPTGLSC
ncbi:MAG TPA: hypothetical protein EYQ31_18230, partial [Candidatus Handelsmanbacteria bacterium]|nr:hypothetical protein [Candidatus Handelsmanbacteria bacterium]